MPFLLSASTKKLVKGKENTGSSGNSCTQKLDMCFLLLGNKTVAEMSALKLLHSLEGHGILLLNLTKKPVIEKNILKTPGALGLSSWIGAFTP